MSAGPCIMHAMGGRIGDVLTLANAWASVDVIREGPRVYTLHGDGVGTYSTLGRAMAAAWLALAEFTDGRAD